MAEGPWESRLDYYQGPPEKEPLAIGGNLPLKKVYEYEPIPKDMKPEEAKHILGAQCQLWAEYLPTTRQVEYMAFPRAAAMSEVLWSPAQRKGYAAFLVRLAEDLKRLDVLDWNYRKLDKE
ncbi:MAG: family 20 glycosylhydrolase [Phycisphaerae bacterium]|nr:family 20 glycosylhydrolase [Phycisphaerae bacterium]